MPYGPWSYCRRSLESKAPSTGRPYVDRAKQRRKRSGK